jgi:hypothetical protein
MVSGTQVAGTATSYLRLPGHRHNSPVGPGSRRMRATGKSRDHASSWLMAEEDREPSTDRQTSNPAETVREARLRPEFASLYPWMSPGVWYLAASVASAARDHEDGQAESERRLSPEHFEFRGAIRPRPAGPRTSRGRPVPD